MLNTLIMGAALLVVVGLMAYFAFDVYREQHKHHHTK
jgi:hypothetical protein